MLGRRDDRLIEIAGPHITDEALGDDLAAMQWPIEAVWVLSRHRAASGQPSLTVHPIGNHGAAEFGGQPGTLSPAAPRDMGALLRRLKARRDEADLPHSVTYESTHHGPLMPVPTLFLEIGSDASWYQDATSGEAVAAAATDVLDGRGFHDAPILVGIGGGHYTPRHTDLALEGRADFGHFLPAYAVDAHQPDPAPLRRAVEATPGCEGVYIHKKGLRGPQRQRVKAWMEEVGVGEWSG